MRITNIRFFTLVALCATLASGCVSPNAYVSPSVADSASLVGAKSRNSLFDWESLAVGAVDDQYVRFPAFGEPSSTAVRLTPGPHRIVVRASFNRQFAGGGPFEAFVTVPVEMAPHASYHLAGRVHDSEFEVWIEDRETGRHVGDTFSAPFRRSNTTTFVPVFVPPAR